MTLVKLEIEQEHASRLLEFECVNYSQWFPGDSNNVADALSQDFSLSDSHLTKLLFNLIFEQVPSSFKIAPLPQEIKSFLLSTLERLPGDSQTREKHTFSKIYHGQGGSSFCSQLVLEIRCMCNNINHFMMIY